MMKYFKQSAHQSAMALKRRSRFMWHPRLPSSPRTAAEAGPHVAGRHAADPREARRRASARATGTARAATLATSRRGSSASSATCPNASSSGRHKVVAVQLATARSVPNSGATRRTYHTPAGRQAYQQDRYTIPTRLQQTIALPLQPRGTSQDVDHEDEPNPPACHLSKPSTVDDADPLEDEDPLSKTSPLLAFQITGYRFANGSWRCLFLN